MAMKGVHFLVVFVFTLAFTFVSASDPSPLQDFCVALGDTKNDVLLLLHMIEVLFYAVFVNGELCKDPKLVVAEDFFFSGLNKPGNTSNPLGWMATIVNVMKIAGLNTLGVSMVRLDYAPNGGLIPPHIHPRASEILVVLEGTLYVGFVTSNPNNTLFTKVLNKGDVFVFPIGLIHFQLNVGNTPAIAIAAFDSQNFGIIPIANAIFGSDPPINPDVLTKAFQVDRNVVNYLQSKFQGNNI
ncbi:Cupin_1 domain-containing protein [Cephalotus follicularis]|uniref:Germin-like protein n=1 Tax=Cephalotus follicularis TaxID=3775 RepID=A0A1Q3BB24_CEPFO|nr:Cupin_1 domain-containing protein [Cephalotus follicularis]